MRRILVVDDEMNMCELLKMSLEKEGFIVAVAMSGREALAVIRQSNAFDLVISDLMLPDIDGMEILAGLKKLDKDAPVVFVTAYGTIERAVDAMKRGAVDFITKPFTKETLRQTVRRALPESACEKRNGTAGDPAQGIVSESRAMREIMRTVWKIARVKSPVLITGESGTGKGMLARAIHDAGKGPGGRSRPPFVGISCPSVPESLFESELFGYQRGAFTGADKDFTGKVRQAEGGTLFLDEIAEIPLLTQPKLLKLLEEKTFEPLGSTAQIRVDTRVICATNRELQELVDLGQFRRDLFYRINTISIRIPSLRERREDILPLAEHFLDMIAVESGARKKTLSDATRRAFEEYGWPGNVRELRNVIERAYVLSETAEIGVADVPLDGRAGPGVVKPRAMADLSSLERQMIEKKLEDCRWNVSAAARELGMERNALRYRLKKYKLK